MGVKMCKVDEGKKELHLVLDLETPRPSKSGKTVVIASTRGNQTTEEKFRGKPIIVGVNAYFKPAETGSSSAPSTKKKGKKQEEEDEEDEED